MLSQGVEDIFFDCVTAVCETQHAFSLLLFYGRCSLLGSFASHSRSFGSGAGCSAGRNSRAQFVGVEGIVDSRGGSFEGRSGSLQGPERTTAADVGSVAANIAGSSGALAESHKGISVAAAAVVGSVTANVVAVIANVVGSSGAHAENRKGISVAAAV